MVQQGYPLPQEFIPQDVIDGNGRVSYSRSLGSRSRRSSSTGEMGDEPSSSITFRDGQIPTMTEIGHDPFDRPLYKLTGKRGYLFSVSEESVPLPVSSSLSNDGEMKRYYPRQTVVYPGRL